MHLLVLPLVSLAACAPIKFDLNPDLSATIDDYVDVGLIFDAKIGKRDP